jgi:hypothetical protein
VGWSRVESVARVVIQLVVVLAIKVVVTRNDGTETGKQRHESASEGSFAPG